ncbi:MAG: endopeptidase La [Calditrichia bacterium]
MKDNDILFSESDFDLLNIEKTVPIIPLRDMVVFPNTIVPLLVGRPGSIAAIQRAEEQSGQLLLVAQKNSEVEEIKPANLYRVGTVAHIVHISPLPNNYMKVVVEGVARADVSRYNSRKNYITARVTPFEPEYDLDKKSDKKLYALLNLFEDYVKSHPNLPEELLGRVQEIEYPDNLLDFIITNLDVPLKDKQKVLEARSLDKVIDLTLDAVKYLLGVQQIRKDLDKQVRDSIMGIQREHYLQEQLRIIKKELGEGDSEESEIERLEEAILAADMPQHAFDKASEELEKLRKTPPYSPEYTVTRNYLDWLVQIPWNKRTEDRLDIEEAQKILDEDHYGLKKPKERIVEHLAVLQRVKKIKGPILCLVGPPGVGKTSLGRSVARALNREFVRISLGGVRDEAEIRGHRRTYIGSMPGKIIQSMKKAATKNPVFLLDEIDKMSMDFRGDPSAALLEVLDPEQNRSFLDHYLDVDYDLSEVFFITTANVQSNIPLPLQDRMEIIELPGYLEHEKLNIARDYLIPKQKKEHGLDDEELEIEEKTVLRIIREYTREAGVRNLEREIAKICRKATRQLLEKSRKRKIRVKAADLENYLGQPTYLFRQDDLNPKVGEALGLAWTPYGGDTLKIEVNLFRGDGKMQLTGKLGDVLKESAQAAMSYIRSVADDYNIPDEIFRERDIHIHLPEGAIPKDGPSAGITLATAMLSAMTGRKVRGNLAMTGEITLRGKVLAIGGLNEKMLAAQRQGIKLVIIPKENSKDLSELPRELREGIEIKLVSHFGEVAELVFCDE